MDNVTLKRYAVDTDGNPYAEEVIWQPTTADHPRAVPISDLPFGPDQPSTKKRMDGATPSPYADLYVWFSMAGAIVDGSPANPYTSAVKPGYSIVTEAAFNGATADRDAKFKAAADQVALDTEAARAKAADARAALAAKLGITTDELLAVLS